MLKEKDINSIFFLYDKYAPAIFGAIFNEVGNHQIAENILEQTFISIWNNHADEINYANHLLAWMLKIAKNNTIKTLGSLELNKISRIENYNANKDRLHYDLRK